MKVLISGEAALVGVLGSNPEVRPIGGPAYAVSSEKVVHQLFMQASDVQLHHVKSLKEADQLALKAYDEDRILRLKALTEDPSVSNTIRINAQNLLATINRSKIHEETESTSPLHESESKTINTIHPRNILFVSHYSSTQEQFNSVHEDMKKQTSLDALTKILADNLAYLGVNHVLAHEITNSSIQFGDVPQKWLDEYRDQDMAKNDPIINAAVKFGASGYWSDLVGRHKLDTRAARVLKLAEDYGISDGFIIPVYVSNGYQIVINFMGRSIDRQKESRLTLSYFAILYAEQFHRILKENDKLDYSREILSKRQMQVLELLARGCMDNEIAMRLGVTRETVHSHLHRLKQNLKIVGRNEELEIIYIRQ